MTIPIPFTGIVINGYGTETMRMLPSGQGFQLLTHNSPWSEAIEEFDLPGNRILEKNSKSGAVTKTHLCAFELEYCYNSLRFFSQSLRSANLKASETVSQNELEKTLSCVDGVSTLMLAKALRAYDADDEKRIFRKDPQALDVDPSTCSRLTEKSIIDGQDSIGRKFTLLLRGKAGNPVVAFKYSNALRRAYGNEEEFSTLISEDVFLTTRIGRLQSCEDSPNVCEFRARSAIQEVLSFDLKKVTSREGDPNQTRWVLRCALSILNLRRKRAAAFGLHLAPKDVWPNAGTAAPGDASVAHGLRAN